MRAAIIRRFGDASVFEIGDIPTPEPHGDDVLIRVAYAGVGVWDAEIRAGAWGEQGAFPLVLGTDGYGIVEAVGPDAGFPIGQRVWAYGYDTKKGGFYAEYACVPSDCVAHAPPHVHDDEAGGAPTVAVTAWTGIRIELVVEATDVVLVHGATSAVGICALQFAAWTGARVYATASHDGDTLRSFGAADVFDVRSDAGRRALREAMPNVTKALLAAPWPAELNAALDGVQVAYPNGVEPVPADARPFDGVPNRELWDAIDPQVTAHRFRLPVAATYPLERVAEAHAAIESEHRFGKIVLRVG